MGRLKLYYRALRLWHYRRLASNVIIGYRDSRANRVMSIVFPVSGGALCAWATVAFGWPVMVPLLLMLGVSSASMSALSERTRARDRHIIARYDTLLSKEDRLAFVGALPERDYQKLHAELCRRTGSAMLAATRELINIQANLPKSTGTVRPPAGRTNKSTKLRLILPE